MDSACAGVNKQVTRFNIIGIFTSMFKNPFGKLINQLISIYDQFSPADSCDFNRFNTHHPITVSGFLFDQMVGYRPVNLLFPYIKINNFTV